MDGCALIGLRSEVEGNRKPHPDPAFFDDRQKTCTLRLLQKGCLDEEGSATLLVALARLCGSFLLRHIQEKIANRERLVANANTVNPFLTHAH